MIHFNSSHQGKIKTQFSQSKQTLKFIAEGQNGRLNQPKTEIPQSTSHTRKTLSFVTLTIRWSDIFCFLYFGFDKKNILISEL